MEGNFQNMMVENQENGGEDVNNDDIPQDTKLVQQEILKMREAKQKSLENTENLQRKLEEEQKAVQDKQLAKTKMEKEIVELQCKLNDKKYQNDRMRTEIGKIREVSKEIGKFCVRNEQTLQQCSQDKTVTVEKKDKLKTKICDNLVKLEEACKKKQSEASLSKENFNSQKQLHKESLENREGECLELKEKLEASNIELENLKKQADEFLQASNSCVNNITVGEKDNKQLEEIWHRKKKRSGDLLQQMEEELSEFEQRKEEILNSLDEARDTLQKKEIELEGVQRGIKNQTEYNKNFQKKLVSKIKEIADLRQRKDHVEAAQKGKRDELIKSEESLTVILNSKLEEEQRAQLLLSEERNILSKTEEQIQEAKQMNAELVRHIETQEKIVSELKDKQLKQLQAISTFEQELYALQTQLNNLKGELSDWQTKFGKYECNMMEAIASKTAQTQTIALQIEDVKNDKQQTTKIVIEEMDSMKINFDIDTAKETGDFEEKQKQLQEQIQMIEKELSYTRTLQMQLDEELQQLNQDCDSISEKIKEQESLNRAFAQTPEAHFEPPVLTLLPPAGRKLRTGISSRGKTNNAHISSPSHPSTSGLILPPPGLDRPRAFDELSGSSAEGTMVTHHQLLEFKREKQRRRQLREQQRLQVKKSSTSHSRTSGK